MCMGVCIVELLNGLSAGDGARGIAAEKAHHMVQGQQTRSATW